MFWLGPIIHYPKKELHSSLWVTMLLDVYIPCSIYHLPESILYTIYYMIYHIRIAMVSKHVYVVGVYRRTCGGLRLAGLSRLAHGILR